MSCNKQQLLLHYIYAVYVYTQLCLLNVILQAAMATHYRKETTATVYIA